jgi:hypothetical protein
MCIFGSSESCIIFKFNSRRRRFILEVSKLLHASRVLLISKKWSFTDIHNRLHTGKSFYISMMRKCSYVIVCMIDQRTKQDIKITNHTEKIVG